MKETDITIYLKKKTKTKRISKKLLWGSKTSFINVDMVIKVHFKIAIAKIVFIYFSINF